MLQSTCVNAVMWGGRRGGKKGMDKGRGGGGGGHGNPLRQKIIVGSSGEKQHGTRGRAMRKALD